MNANSWRGQVCSSRAISIRKAYVLALLCLIALFSYTTPSLLTVLTGGKAASPSYLHRPVVDLGDLHTRHKEAGMFRSKWFGYREFYKDASGTSTPSNVEDEFGKRDRICIRFNPNRTINLYSKKVRPLVQMGEYYFCGFGYGDALSNPLLRLAKKTAQDTQLLRNQQRVITSTKQKTQSKRSVEEVKEERAIQKLLERERLFNVDGIFTSDLDSPTWMRVKADLKEHDQEGEEVRTRYEISYTWGKVDKVAQKFSLGRIYKFPDSRDSFKRVGAYVAGVFSFSANPHRPLVGKEFLAFQ